MLHFQRYATLNRRTKLHYCYKKFHPREQIKQIPIDNYALPYRGQPHDPCEQKPSDARPLHYLAVMRLLLL